MRTHVIDRLIERARVNERIVLLVGDLGYNVVEGFAKEFPDRFINCGIAEQNMMSVAAGMALEGDIVFVYSIGNFPTLRCIEQIRNDVCYHSANVKIISVGGGFSYGSLGMSHHTTEELGMLRTLPQMNVYAPADHFEAVAVLDKMIDEDSPGYIRLARGSDAVIHPDIITSDVSRLIPFRVYEDGSYDVSIITTGTVLTEAVAAMDILNGSSVKTRVFSCPTIKPIDSTTVSNLGNTSRLLVTVEEHNILGGLGGAVAEVLCSLSSHSPLLRIGLHDVYSSIVGSTEYLRRYYQMDCESIVKIVLESL